MGSAGQKFRHIGNVPAFGTAPAGVFVILGIAKAFVEAAAFPKGAANAAAGHAEKMRPIFRFAAGAEAARSRKTYPQVETENRPGALPKNLRRKGFVYKPVKNFRAWE
ncbi:MAG: hypothetical protein KGJ88_08050 [Verrucomicrobiota bacterium]|nr:hypothetical protein [Verrucomicrobiota bacterium]